MKFGHIITDQPYLNGIAQAPRTYHEESIAIEDNQQLINEILAGLDSIMDKTSDEVIITIKRNKEDKLRLIRKARIK